MKIEEKNGTVYINGLDVIDTIKKYKEDNDRLYVKNSELTQNNKILTERIKELRKTIVEMNNKGVEINVKDSKEINQN